MSNVTDSWEIQACVDCRLVASGYSPAETGHALHAEPLGFILGHEGRTAANTSVTDDDDDPEPHFSWSPCEGCGSTLGGDRYTMIVTVFDD